MRYLTNIAKKEDVKVFIESNSDKIVNVIKTKFKVNELYSNIVENLENFSNENVETFYNNIKNYATKYTCDFLNENSKKNLI